MRHDAMATGELEAQLLRDDERATREPRTQPTRRDAMATGELETQLLRDDELAARAPETQPTRHDAMAGRGVILLAEDSEAFAELVAFALAGEGQVVRLEDGFELRDYVDVAVDGRWPVPRPALVVTDLRMPGLNGLEAIRASRAAGLRCPVILLTAFPDDVVREEAQALDVTVVEKPVELDVLRDTIRRLLENAPR